MELIRTQLELPKQFLTAFTLQRAEYKLFLLIAPQNKLYTGIAEIAYTIKQNNFPSFKIIQNIVAPKNGLVQVMKHFLNIFVLFEFINQFEHFFRLVFG